MLPRTNLLLAGEVDLAELALADVLADLEVRHAPLLTRRHRTREWRPREGGEVRKTATSCVEEEAGGRTLVAGWEWRPAVAFGLGGGVLGVANRWGNGIWGWSWWWWGVGDSGLGFAG